MNHRVRQTEFIAGDLQPWPAGRVIITPEVSQLADRLPAPYEVISFDGSQSLLEFACRTRAVVLTSSRLSAGEKHAGILIVDPENESLIDELTEIAPLIWPDPRRSLSPEALARLTRQVLRYAPYAAAVLVLVLVTVFGWQWWSAHIPASVHEQTVRATVSIFLLHSSSGGGVHRCGTGSIVGHSGDHTLILSASHCLPEPGTPVFIQTYPFDELSTARVLHIYRDPTRDLCILKVPRIDAPATLRVRAKAPRKPTVFIAGLPRSTLTTVRCAAEAQVHFELNSTSATCWKLDASLDPGASGSPVVCRAGHVLGVYVAHNGATGYAVALDEIQRFLDYAGFRWLYEPQEEA